MQRVHRFTVIIVFILLAAGSAWAVDGQIKIAQTASTTFPIIINKAGSYVLTSNLIVSDPNANAITIEVNDITLDLNGHKIQGPGTGTGHGIEADNKYSITIKNGRVWGFGSHGIYLYSSTAHPSYYGAGHLISGIQATNNRYGIEMSGGVVTNCSANSNALAGFFVVNATVSNCTANNNRGQSPNFAIGFQTGNSTITDCTAINNDNGFRGNYNAYIGCTANENRFDGFDTDRSTVANCSVNRNGAYGIHAETDCSITNCTVYFNGSDGIYSALRSIIKGCTVTYNVGYGIRLTSNGLGCYVYRNAVSGNGGGQISCGSFNTCVDNAN
jgi:hypothetical protein